MADYIEREAAIKIAESYGLSNGSTLGRHSGIADAIAAQIASIPAADVAPVVHGSWELECDGYWHCSQCGRRVYSPMFSPSFIHQKDDKQYCPSCGAKMDLQMEQKEEAQNEP